MTRRAALGLAGLVPLLPFAVPTANGMGVPGPQEVVGDLAATVLGEPVTDPRMILRDAMPPTLQHNPVTVVENMLMDIGGKTYARSVAGSRRFVPS